MKSEIVIPKWAWITGILILLLGLGNRGWCLAGPSSRDRGGNEKLWQRLGPDRGAVAG